MNRPQRLALIAVAVVVAVAAFVVLRPKSESKTAAGAGSGPVAASLSAGTVRMVSAVKGQTIKLTAMSKTGDEVHVHGYDLMRDAPAGVPVTLTFTASIAGIFEVEFEKAGTQIAKLTVRP